MAKYIVHYTRKEMDGYDEQALEIPVEALDPSAAALIAGALILADSLVDTSVGDVLALYGVDPGRLGDVTADAFKDCVNVTVTTA